MLEDLAGMRRWQFEGRRTLRGCRRARGDELQDMQEDGEGDRDQEVPEEA